MRITVDRCPEAEFALKLRIPGWCPNAQVKVNGTILETAAAAASYCELRRVWKAGDTVELTLSMEPQLITAHPLVEETTRQVAIRRGPVVYCVESADLPSGVNLDSVLIPADAQLTAHYEAGLLGGVGIVELPAISQQTKPWERELYRPLEPTKDRQFTLRLIPYYAWANRGPGEMSVWLPLR